LGNGAIALGLLESGCQVLTSYPGTPSSEILPEVLRLKDAEGLRIYVEWSTNEKVALDNAYAAAIAGKRAACCMKQVGLNVAADTLMSAAYTGITGGLVIISCDDPGPHSSQTEQDTRLLARVAKIPVLDPSNPLEAREMVKLAMDLSLEFRVPVVLRPAIRVCHGRQALEWAEIKGNLQEARFEKDPARWAATPQFRLMLHGELNEKLRKIGTRFSRLQPFNRHDLEPGRHYPLGIVAGGVPFAVIRDILSDVGRRDIPVLKIGTPFPFPEALASDFTGACDRVLVIEETDSLMEYLLRDREKVMGRLTGHVPAQGELVPGMVYDLLDRTLRDLDLPPLPPGAAQDALEIVGGLDLPPRRPTLCPGCPHRASFFAIRKAKPRAIFTSDIGCYTLGLNQGVVDTCLDMGAAITMASGLYHAFEQDGNRQPIVATIGDSTFYHSGTAGLMNAVYNGARFILVVLDNGTTAMTGMQPTPASGLRADGGQGKAIPLKRIISGCGVDFIQEVDPYDIKAMTNLIKEAGEFVNDPERGGIAVIIASHPCVIADRAKAIPEIKRIEVTDDCVGCDICLDHFGCPALEKADKETPPVINPGLCVGCGVCLEVCPQGAFVVTR